MTPRKKLNVLKEQMEKFYEKKVEGIIVKLVKWRASWHECSKKTLKVFL